MLKLSVVIPEKRKALVTTFTGQEKIIIGPVRIFTAFKKVEIFEQEIINEGEEATIVDEKGKRTTTKGPIVVDIHPRGQLFPHEVLQLAENEAVVIIREDGQRKIIKGKDEPRIFIAPFDTIYQFAWTGGTEEKVPEGLKFTKLRLQDDQMYYTFTSRTKDQVVVKIFLMIFWRITNLDLLVNKSSDPLGAILNKIYADMTTCIGQKKFDEFIVDTETQLQAIPLLKEDGKKFFAGYGIEIKFINLRRWECTSQEVQRVLDRAGTVMTQGQIAEAEHNVRLRQLEYKQTELVKEAQLSTQEEENFRLEGKREGLKLSAIFEELKTKINEENAAKLLAIKIASDKGSNLYLGQDFLPDGKQNDKN